MKIDEEMNYQQYIYKDVSGKAPEKYYYIHNAASHPYYVNFGNKQMIEIFHCQISTISSYPPLMKYQRLINK
ncbi:hypothetical protein ACH3XW_39690 [Acanthocheilonema viteae]